jgi:hypothetical protein
MTPMNDPRIAAVERKFTEMVGDAAPSAEEQFALYETIVDALSETDRDRLSNFLSSKATMLGVGSEA